MEISNKIPPIQHVQNTASAKNISKAKPVTKGDRVELSSKARELQTAHEAVRRLPDVDMDKVAKIKAQLKDGTYKVDSQKIAGAMLTEALLKESR